MVNCCKRLIIHTKSWHPQYRDNSSKHVSFHFKTHTIPVHFIECDKTMANEKELIQHIVWRCSLKLGIPLVGISGGSKGGREGRTPPPLRPNSFNFMQFLGEFGKIACSCPPLGGFTPPPWGNPGSVTGHIITNIYIKFLTFTDYNLH